MSEPFHEANERLRDRKRIENDMNAEIERLTEELSMEEECFENLANDFKRVEAENRKLRYVMETAQTMREDYECYSLSEDGTYGTALHDPEIMKDFDNAIEAVR